jgi:predicted transcriptional regulator
MKFIRVILNKKEKENLQAYANKNGLTATKVLVNLIYNFNGELQTKNLPETDFTMSFKLKEEVIKELDKLAKKYNTTKNKFIRSLIVSIPEQNEFTEKKYVTEDIKTYLSFEDKIILKDIAHAKKLSINLLVRQELNEILKDINITESDLRAPENPEHVSVFLTQEENEYFQEKANQFSVSKWILLRAVLKRIIKKYKEEI